MKQLTVYLNRNLVGTLSQDANGLLGFRYAPTWLQNPDAIPISRSLPLRNEAFRGKEARPFFAGVLPDEGPRQQIAAILGVSERNDFAILERIGGECAGAICLLPTDTALPENDTQPRRRLTTTELNEIIAELPRRPLLAGREGVRLSLAGVQGKLPIILDKDTFFLPLGSSASTHILKPEPERFPGLVAAEVFCMTLAKALGLAVPDLFRLTIAGKPCLLIKRYDRMIDSAGTVQRIHQEDFCQAMGYPPERKYQQEGGPLLRDCIAMIRSWSSAPVLDIRDFLNAVIFNMLVGNADAHGKNYSLLYQNGSRRLAPSYDIVCTLVWPELSKKPAMKIGQCDSIDAITPAHWQKMTQEASLSWPPLRERLVSFCQALQAALPSQSLRQATGDDEMYKLLTTIVDKRVTTLLQALT